MFKKLVSNLPFNPGLIQQVAFYGKRLHREKSIRRIGFGFMGATLVVNILAVISPAQNTLASSANDIVYGATSKQVVVNALQNGVDNGGRKDIKQIYGFFGITLDDVKNACAVNLYPSPDLQTYNTSQAPGCSDRRLASFNGHLITDGRFMTAQAGNPHYNYIKNAEDRAWLDKAQDIPGTGSRIYFRPLQVWGENYSTTQAISGYASGNGMLKGKRFWILLKGCGNITFERFAVQPKIEISKSKVSAVQTLHPNDLLDYKIQYRNTGSATASDVKIEDTLDNNFAYVSQTSSDLTFSQNGQKLTWTRPLLPVTEWQDIVVRVKAKSPGVATKQVCNVASILASGIASTTSSNGDSEKCVTIDNRCPGTDLVIPDGGIEKCKYTCPDGTIVDYNRTANCPTPTAVCNYLKILSSPSWDKRTFEAHFTLSGGAKLDSVKLQINGTTKKDFGSVNETRTLTSDDIQIGAGNYTASLVVQPKNGTTYNAGNSCSLSDTIAQQFTRISNSKKVKNITTGGDYATAVSARAGDVLEYAVTVSNAGNIDQNDYVIQPDSLGDVLEYADVTDQNGANFDRTNQKLVWPATTVVAGASITKTFKVTMKTPIPTTPASLSDPLSFDYKMTNFYGNEVTINIDKPTPAKVEQTVTKLPNTGGGSSLVITFILVCVLGFFYMRSKLLAKEVDIVRYEYSRGA